MKNSEFNVNTKVKFALENVLEMNIEKEKYFEAFCEKLELMNIDDSNLNCLRKF